MSRRRVLLFIIADRPSLLAAKGEMISRYYNPGDYFDEVHLLSTTSDAADPARLALTVGRARLFIHRLWKRGDLWQMAASPLLKRLWAARVVDLARQIRPDIVRSGDRYTAYLAAHARKALSIPHLVSLHTHRPDAIGHLRPGLHRALLRYEAGCARAAIGAADAVVIVYESIRDYALGCGARRIELIYNVISPDLHLPKSTYDLGSPPRLVSVGRLLPRKMPLNAVLALRYVDAEMLVIGTGPGEGLLRETARRAGLAGKVRFCPAMPNSEVCASLLSGDVFVAQTKYPEFPKTIMEALWLGVPVVVNRDQSIPVPEFGGDWVSRVDDTPEGYAAGLQRLLSDDTVRESLGRNGRRFAEITFDPRVMEERQVALYRELVA